METYFVILPSSEQDDMALRESDARILDAAARFSALQNKTSELLARAEDRHLTGSPGTIYLKKLGHRPLSTADFESLVNNLGADEDKQTLLDYRQAQIDMSARLKATKAIGVVLEQAEVSNNHFYNRVKKPYLWETGEVIKIMEVLDRMRL